MKRIFALVLYCMLPLSSLTHASLPPQLTQDWKPQHIYEATLTIRAPELAESGASVPIEILEIKPPEPGVFVRELRLYVDSDLSKPIASFVFDSSAVPTANLRIKLGQTSTVYAYARLSNGNVLTSSKQIKVTIGGCGGGDVGGVGGPAPSVQARSPGLVYDYNAEQRERYGAISGNPIKQVMQDPVSTFSIDVDTAAYANVRRFLTQGQLPPTDAVRVEELINYFDYGYAAPSSRARPFAIHTEMARTPWNPHSYLLRLGIKGYEVSREQLPPANLVFLVDVSGSMFQENRLPLVQKSLGLLVRRLSARDRVSLVTYAGYTQVVLPATPGNQTERILSAINQLAAGGGTNGGAGIQLAYAEARKGFVAGGINRVLIATDGDFNVGVTSQQALLDLVRREREAGIALTTLGFGMGNHNHHLLEMLADTGNGNHAYIDNLNEARKVLVEQAAGTLHTIAKDVKIQIEFNPALVREYRLIGYEKRLLKREDFNNDKVDAGDLGAGHTVTALYEVTLAGEPASSDPMRYGNDVPRAGHATELAWVKLGYKSPDEDRSQRIELPINRTQLKPLRQASADLRFAAAVAGFGQLLRGGEYLHNFGMQDVLTLAQSARGDDAKGYRAEFLRLVGLAQELQPRRPAPLASAEIDQGRD